MKEDSVSIGFAVGFAIVAMIGGCFIGYMGKRDEMRIEIVKHRAAYWRVDDRGVVTFTWRDDIPLLQEVKQLK